MSIFQRKTSSFSIFCSEQPLDLIRYYSTLYISIKEFQTPFYFLLNKKNRFDAVTRQIIPTTKGKYEAAKMDLLQVKSKEEWYQGKLQLKKSTKGVSGY